jgi:hypothetical protein
MQHGGFEHAYFSLDISERNLIAAPDSLLPVHLF